MKTKKYLLLAVFFLSAFVQAQTQVTDTVYLQVMPESIEQLIIKQGSSYDTLYQTSTDEIGRRVIASDTSKHIYRSYFYYSLEEIPETATIQSAKVEYSNSGSGYSFKLTKLTTINQGDLKASWETIKNGSGLNSGIAYQPSGNFTSSEIKTAIQNSLAARQIIIGALSENETAANSNSSLEMTVRVIFTRPAETLPYVARNDCHGGKGGLIGVGIASEPISHVSPYGFTANENQKVNLRAYDNQTIDDNMWLFNDIEASNEKSKWRIWRFGRLYDFSIKQDTNFTALTDNGGNEYIAFLKKNCKIRVDAQTEFDGLKTNQSENYIIEQNIGEVIAPTIITDGGKTYQFSYWTDNPSTPNPRYYTPTDNDTLTGYYKALGYSNNLNTSITNPGRNKIVRTSNQRLHRTYESMGKIWYEYSDNSGLNWQLGNDGLYIDSYSEYSAIACSGNYVLITYISPSNIDYEIRLATINSDGHVIENINVCTIQQQSNGYYPAIAVGGDNSVIIIWNVSEGLMYRCGKFYDSYPFHWFSSAKIVSGTNYSSKQQAVCWGNVNNFSTYHLVWLQNEDKIMYKTLKLTYSGPDNASVTQSAPEIPSAFSGTLSNGFPSVIAVGNGARVIWISSMDDTIVQDPPIDKLNWKVENITFYQRVVMRSKNDDGSWGNKFWKLGSEVAFAHINKSTNNNNAIAYSTRNKQNAYYKNSNFDNSYGLGISGQDIHISNGLSDDNLYAMVVAGSANLCWFPVTSLNITNKTNGIISSSAREGIISKDDIDYSFAFGDIKLNGQEIVFVPVEEEQSIVSINDLNSYLKSGSFTLTDNDQFEFGIYTAVTDSAAAASNLNSNEFIEYSVRLVDDATGEVIGEYFNLRTDDGNIIPFYQDNFIVEANGIGNKTVHLELNITTNIHDECALADVRATGEVIQKTNYNHIAYNGESPVTEYKLEQNYPNPFNPTTTIVYQIPKNDQVTVKVYDILGREIATLVNEFQKVGRYEVKFNGGSLASGVYIYTIKTNNFTDNKKFVLMK